MGGSAPRESANFGARVEFVKSVGTRCGASSACLLKSCHPVPAFAVMLSVLTSVALSALFNIRYALEARNTWRRSALLQCAGHLRLTLNAPWAARFRVLQDPFVEGSLDTIRVRGDMAETMRILRLTAKGGPLFDDAAAGSRPTSGILSVVVS